MTKLEFKKFLNDYKEVNEIGIEGMPPIRDYLGICISGGRIFLITENVGIIQKTDITEKVLNKLMPDNFIF